MAINLGLAVKKAEKKGEKIYALFAWHLLFRKIVSKTPFSLAFQINVKINKEVYFVKILVVDKEN